MRSRLDGPSRPSPQTGSARVRLSHRSRLLRPLTSDVSHRETTDPFTTILFITPLLACQEEKREEGNARFRAPSAMHRPGIWPLASLKAGTTSAAVLEAKALLERTALIFPIFSAPIQTRRRTGTRQNPWQKGFLAGIRAISEASSELGRDAADRDRRRPKRGLGELRHRGFIDLPEEAGRELMARRGGRLRCCCSCIGGERRTHNP